MKRAFVLFVSVAALAIAVLTISAVPGPSVKKKPASITGTWELVSYKYGFAQSAFIDVPKSQCHYKLITDTHFTWVSFSTDTKKVMSSAGGAYTLEGNTYTESLDYGLGMDAYLGNKCPYTIKVEGDMFFLSGFLTEGYKIEEIWKRVK
jgi:hypothetical protein